MASKHHTDEVYKSKSTKGKLPPKIGKFNIVLNAEQKRGKSTILANTVTVVTGKAGSGKTLLAAQVALDQKFNKRLYDKIVIARPPVEMGKGIGFLPGDLKEKLEPFLEPFYSNFGDLASKELIEQLEEQGHIEILPLNYVRGRTYSRSFVIVDEAQNCTDSELQAILGRIGLDSKLVICGDSAQIDLQNKKSSGFDYMEHLAEKIDDFAIVKLKKNHRHKIVEDILKEYEIRDNGKPKLIVK
tara:strand:+ start:357 stop:1085 length:729 start_codon:yes stop_codon:yes gene_type:complete